MKPSQDPTEGMGPCEFLWGRGSSRQHGLCKGPWATWCLAGGVEGILRPQGVGGVGDEHTEMEGVGTRLCRWTKALSQSLLVCCPNCWTPIVCGRKAQVLATLCLCLFLTGIAFGPGGLQQVGLEGLSCNLAVQPPATDSSTSSAHHPHFLLSQAEPGLMSWSPQSGEKQL